MAPKRGRNVLSGLAVASRLREEPSLSGMLLIALTGYGSHADVAQSKVAGFDRHLVKPVAIQELKRVLDALFESHGPA